MKLVNIWMKTNTTQIFIKGQRRETWLSGYDTLYSFKQKTADLSETMNSKYPPALDAEDASDPAKDDDLTLLPMLSMFILITWEIE